MDKRLSAMVVLSLAILKVKTYRKTKVPSLEELAALYDGKLSNKRREQVLSHLSKNDDLYSQWLLIVESMDQVHLDKSDFIINIKNSKQKISILNSLRDLFDAHFLVPGFIACLVSFLTITIVFNQKIGLNDLYQNYANNGQNLVSLPSRSYFENINLLAENEYKIIREGYDNGVGSLDLDAKKIGTSNTETLRYNIDNYTQQQALYYDLGAWVAIVNYQCKGNNDQFFIDASEVLHNILKGLSSSEKIFSDMLTSKLYSYLDKEQEQGLQAKLCGVARLIVGG